MLLLKIRDMDNNIKRYIKREFYKGKSLPARLIDSVFLKILAFMVIFIFFWLLGTGFLRSIVLAATLVSSFGILKFVYNRSRYMSFSARRIERAGDECALERMILLDERHRTELVRRMFAQELQTGREELRPAGEGFLFEKTYCRYFDSHPKVPVGVNELIALVREMRELRVKKCILMTPSRFDEDARAMAVRRSDSCIFLENKELLKCLRGSVIYPSEKQIYIYLSAEIAERRITREKLRGAFFGADKGRSFALCAAVLLAMPLFTGQSIIYPVAAAVCTGLSIYGFTKGRRG